MRTLILFAISIYITWSPNTAFDYQCGCPEVPMYICVVMGETYRTILNSCLADCLQTRFGPVVVLHPGKCNNDQGKISETIKPECSRNCRRCKTKTNIALIASNESSLSLSDEEVLLGSVGSKADSDESEDDGNENELCETHQAQEKLFLNAEQQGLCIEDEFTVCAFNGRTYSSACLVECDLGVPAIMHWGTCADYGGAA